MLPCKGMVVQRHTSGLHAMLDLSCCKPAVMSLTSRGVACNGHDSSASCCWLVCGSASILAGTAAQDASV